MKFYGELLIIFILLIANGRILIIKNAKKDSLVVLSPLGFVLSVIQIFNWGLDAITFLTLLLSVLVLLSNFHALFRYSERLYIDHYSILMKVWAGITIIFALALIGGTIFFAPVEYSSTELGVQEKLMRYEGSFRSGFEDASIINSANLFVTEFTPQNKQTIETKDVVLFIPDKRADTYYYRPYLQYLAREGFTVLSADFFCKDCRWRHSIGDLKICRRTAMLIDWFMNNDKFWMQKEFYTYNSLLELEELGKLVNELYGEKTRLFIVTDVMATDAAINYQEKNPERVMAVFDLQTIPEYKTPGLGIIRQTDLITALALGQERDKDGEATKKMVMETKKKVFLARSGR
ncbi:MAG: hypothetical protein J5726_04220 [Treponema sp.]|nr:hypothetical protein [Treponema sp.]